MKFRCERDVLVEALSTAGRAVDSRGNLPGLSGARLSLTGDDLTITGTNLDLTISSRIGVAGQADGVAFVPARLASDIVKALGPGAVSFAATDDSLSITSGRSEFSIRLISEAGFPETPDATANTVSLSAPQFAEALRKVVLAASTDDSRPILTGVLLSAEENGLRLVATDSFRLAMCDVPGVSILEPGQKVLIPSRALGELHRILPQADTVELTFMEKNGMFKVGDVSLVTTLIEGDFPKTETLIPQSLPNKLTVVRQELLEALRRVKLLARESTPIRLELGDGSLDVVAVTEDVGTARESVECNYEGHDLTIAFNPQFLMEGVEVTPGDEIVLSSIDELKPAVIRSVGNEADDYLYLLMPVRVAI